MERLTEKETTEMFDNLAKYYFTEKYLEAINKLGQLEDIEEELGIELLTLFKDKGFRNFVKCYIENRPFAFTGRKHKELEK